MPTITCDSLLLGAPGPGERLVLVRTTDGIRLCREDGYQALPAFRAVECIERLHRRDMVAARDFMARARLYSFPLQNLDDASLLALLRGQLRAGELAVLREGEGGAGEDASDVKQRRLVRRIEAKSGGRLSHAGRQYRLVADSRLGSLADRDYFEVVGHRDAVEVLSALAGQSSDGDLAQLLGEAAGMLTHDWRPPFQPDGLVLLRRIIVQQAYKPDLGSALTPSQIKKLAESDWIEIELVDEAGKPCPMLYQLELTDQSVREGRFGEDGFLGVYEIASGTCRLTIGDVQEAAELPDEDAANNEACPESDPAEQEETCDQEPSVPPLETVLAWYEIELLDHDGTPLDGVEVKIESGGVTRTGTTVGGGICRIEELPEGNGFGTMSFANEAALRERLAAAWAGSGYRSLATGEDRDKVVPVSNNIGKLLTPVRERQVIRLKPNVVRVRLVGMHFDNAKCFLLPCAMPGIRKVREIYQRYPEAELYIAGHTDTKHHGSDQEGARYNQQLSEERAEAVRGYLADDVDAWIGWYGYGRTPSWEKQWGKAEDAYMLSALPAGRTSQADQPSRRALIADYMALDTVQVSEDFLNIVMKTAGYGSEHLAVPTGPNQDEPRNRRVEIFVIDGPAPDLPDYDVLSTLAAETYDFDSDGAGTRVLELRFHTPNGAALGATWFKVNGGAAEQADRNGYAQICVPDQGCVSVTVEFGAGSANGPYPYGVEVAVDCDEGDDNTQAYSKLHNLGYSYLDDLVDRVRAFQMDYGITTEAGLDAAGQLPRLTKERLWAQYDRDTMETRTASDSTRGD